MRMSEAVDPRIHFGIFIVAPFEGATSLPLAVAAARKAGMGAANLRLRHRWSCVKGERSGTVAAGEWNLGYF